jgi:hypothetical protein
MVAFRVRFFDDGRLCVNECHPSGIAFYKLPCTGDCDADKQILAYHGNGECRDQDSTELGFLPGSTGVEAFRTLWPKEAKQLRTGTSPVHLRRTKHATLWQRLYRK